MVKAVMVCPYRVSTWFGFKHPCLFQRFSSYENSLTIKLFYSPVLINHILWIYRQPGNEVFGDVKKLITQEFVQQGWITYKRLPDTDPVKFEFSWGAKAHALTSKDDVLSFVCQVRGHLIFLSQIIILLWANSGL